MRNLEIGHLVSVCVPVYKVKEYIGRCAQSLFEQTYENIEYVFVDDCSPDNSITILQSTIDKYPSRKSQIHVIRHEINKGLGEARNTAVLEAKGEFILHVDSDDYIDPTTVEKLVAKQQETNADIVKYPKKVLYDNQTILEEVYDYSSPRELLEDILTSKIAGNVCGNLIRKSLYCDNEIRVECGVNQSEDFQVIPRLLYYAKRIAVVNDVFYYYDRAGENSYSNNMSERSYQQVDKTLTLLDVFFVDKKEERLRNLLWMGEFIALCRAKIRYCKTDNRYMYDYVCSMIKMYSPNMTTKLAYKYRLMMSCRNYQLFNVLIFLKKMFRC